MSQLININDVGELAANIGSPLFGGHFFHLFGGVLPSDNCTVFAFRRGCHRPDSIVIEGRSREMREIAQSLAMEYVAEGFVDDPNIPQQRHGDLTTTVRYLNADQLQQGDYRLRFYDKPHLAHELVLLGHMDDTLYYSSFYRTDRHAAFTPSELALLQQVAAFSLKALHRHFQVLNITAAGSETGPDRSSEEQQQSLRKTLQQALLAEPCGLSWREADVCAGIILGQTTVDISKSLSISLNTVATHRKRAYLKLGICSQHELFSRYFQLVKQRAN